MMSTIFLGVVMFTLVVLGLVTIILAARSKLVNTGDININLNEKKDLTLSAGSKLLNALGSAEIFVPSACGSARLKFLKAVEISCQQRQPILLKKRRGRERGSPARFLLRQI